MPENMSFGRIVDTSRARRVVCILGTFSLLLLLLLLLLLSLCSVRDSNKCDERCAIAYLL
jgi:hypothetical protein